MASESEHTGVKLRVKLVVGKGTSFEWEQWSTTVTCLTQLGLPTLTQQQTNTMRNIIETVWMNEVTIQELEQLVYEMFPDGVEKDLKKALKVPEYNQSKDFMIVKSFPVKKERGFEKYPILVQETPENCPEWVGLNTSTIEKVPFLEALMSERWKKENTIATVSNVIARNLRLVEYVFKSGRDFENHFITGFPLAKFNLRPKEVWQDLGFLNIPYKINLQKKKNVDTIENASVLILTMEKFEADIKLDPQVCGNLVENILNICRNPDFFGKKLCQCLEYCLKKELFSKQKLKRIEKEIMKSKEANKWFYDELEDQLFDASHDRNLRKEREELYQPLAMLGLGGNCPNINIPSLPCTCHHSIRANNHGYVDESNWDYECWGRFSAGSD
eukprot:GFUD01101895.1.p1 GENE.GFUD01101895.1~~GFUD01101895.1.p1  ORF type:complete len:387 (-),score=73.78 GFUD01101895.1:24-1184(-)